MELMWIEQDGSVVAGDRHRLYGLANPSDRVISTSPFRITGSANTPFEVCNQSRIRGARPCVSVADAHLERIPYEPKGGNGYE